MNTLSDTDKRRARPSVWPVHVVAVIVVAPAFLVCGVIFALGGPLVAMPIAVLAFTTIWGIVRLRPWGWWYAVVGIFVYAVFCLMLTVVESEPTEPTPMWWMAVNAAIIVLLVWLLAAHRQLFFPPKQEGEE